MNTRPQVGEAARKLSQSVAQLAESTAEYVGGRVNQVDDALRTQRRRWIWMLLSACAALLWMMVATLFTGLAIVMAFWESHRVLAAAAVAAGFVLLAASAAGLLWYLACRRVTLSERLTRLIALFFEARLLR